MSKGFKVGFLLLIKLAVLCIAVVEKGIEIEGPLFYKPDEGEEDDGVEPMWTRELGGEDTPPHGCHDWLPDPGSGHVVTSDDDNSTTGRRITSEENAAYDVHHRRALEAERLTQLGEYEEILSDIKKDYIIYEEKHSRRRLCGYVSTYYCRTCSAGYYNYRCYRYRGRYYNWGCARCPSGKTSPYGSWHYSQCRGCPTGKYGTSTCYNCPSGTYNPNGGRTSIGYCYTCPSGRYSGGGAGSCSYCTRGKYSAPNRRSCLVCTAGRYCSGNG